jgi:hypothetical protein
MDIEMYPYKIEIDGSRYDGNPDFRIYRIQRIVGYAQALAELDNNEEFCSKIKSIYDYKGDLTIAWISEPTEAEKGYLQKAWGSVVACCEGNQIEHEIEK